MVIFGHSVGESWSVRPVESESILWYFVFAFHKVIIPFNISLPATSEGKIAPTAFGLV